MSLVQSNRAWWLAFNSKVHYLSKETFFLLSVVLIQSGDIFFTIAISIHKGQRQDGKYFEIEGRNMTARKILNDEEKLAKKWGHNIEFAFLGLTGMIVFLHCMAIQIGRSQLGSIIWIFTDLCLYFLYLVHFLLFEHSPFFFLVKSARLGLALASFTVHIFKLQINPLKCAIERKFNWYEQKLHSIEQLQRGESQQRTVRGISEQLEAVQTENSCTEPKELFIYSL